MCFLRVYGDIVCVYMVPFYIFYIFIYTHFYATGLFDNVIFVVLIYYLLQKHYSDFAG